jgi:signal transduction histidine kinase
MAWLLRMPQGRFELGLALLLTVAGELELALHDLIDRPSQAIAAAFVTLPLALRFRYPLAVLVVVSAAWVIETALGVTSGDPVVPVIALLLAVYAVGSRCHGWRFWFGGAVAAVGLTAQVLIREGLQFDALQAVAIPAAGLLVGRALGELTFETDVLEERASQLERERDERIRAAVADERSRMARELHDVIGHSISVMGVQAGAVRHRLGDHQTQERDALLAVERTGRQAVAEMRRLIGLLRTEMNGYDDASPSLARVGQLVADLRAAGMTIDLVTDGELEGLPPGVDLAGYRIVQEALTNALKHAPQARVRVRVRCGERELALSVTDDGDPSAQADGDHVGHGMVGMRERAALYGGTLLAEPQPGGGYLVEAVLPLEPV